MGEGLVKTGIIPPKAGVFICYPKKLLSPFLKENRTNFCPLKRVRVETDLRNWPHFSYTEDLVTVHCRYGDGVQASKTVTIQYLQTVH